MRKRVLRSVMLTLAILLGASMITVATGAPAQAAPPCWTTYTNLAPAPGASFGLTYYNCTNSTVVITPLYRSGDGTTWIYKGCKVLGPWAWDSWTVRNPSDVAVSFGVGTCRPELTNPYKEPVVDIWHNPCWTDIYPTPGPGELAVHTYTNCAGRTEVVPYYREADGDIGVYLYQGTAELDPPYIDSTGRRFNWRAKWKYTTPSTSGFTLGTAFAINLP